MQTVLSAKELRGIGWIISDFEHGKKKRGIGGTSFHTEISVILCKHPSSFPTTNPCASPWIINISFIINGDKEEHKEEIIFV